MADPTATAVDAGDGGRPAFVRLSPGDLVKSVALVDPNGHPSDAVGSGRQVSIRVRYDGQAAGEPVTVALGLYRADGTHVASINSGATTRGLARFSQTHFDRVT